MKLLIIVAMSFSLFAQDDMNWDVEGDLSQADMEVLDLAADDEQDVADVSDYDYVEDRIEDEQTALSGQEPAQDFEPYDQGQAIEDEVQSSRAAIQKPEQAPIQEENYDNEQRPLQDGQRAIGDQPVEGSAPLYSE